MLQFIPTKVAKCGCTSPSTGVAIVNSSHLKQLLGDRCTDNTSTSGCRDQPHHNTATLSSHLQHQHIQIITTEASVTVLTSIHRWITNQKLFQISSFLPCRVQCGVFRSCYPSSLSWQEWQSAWPGWWLHEWLLPLLWSISPPIQHDRRGLQ